LYQGENLVHEDDGKACKEVGVIGYEESRQYLPDIKEKSEGKEKRIMGKVYQNTLYQLWTNIIHVYCLAILSSKIVIATSSRCQKYIVRLFNRTSSVVKRLKHRKKKTVLMSNTGTQGGSVQTANRARPKIIKQKS
jgi:hypothetical protein